MRRWRHSQGESRDSPHGEQRVQQPEKPAHAPQNIQARQQYVPAHTPMHRPLTCLPELKVLPTQPETPTIPEEEEDDDGTGRALADHDESEGVEVRLLGFAERPCMLSTIAGADSRDAVLHAHLPDPKGHSPSRRPASHQVRKSQAPAGDSVLYRSVRPYSCPLPRFNVLTTRLTCSTYNLQAMQAYLASRPAYHRTHPRMFDTECLHTPYLPPPTPGPHGMSAHRNSPRLKPVSGAGHVPEGDLLNLGNDYSSTAHKRASSPSRSNQNQNQNEVKRQPGFSKRPGSGRKKSSSGSTSKDTGADGMTDSEREEDDDFEDEWIPDVFLFEYGCVVLWGMTEREEKKFLASMCVF